MITFIKLKLQLYTLNKQALHRLAFLIRLPPFYVHAELVFHVHYREMRPGILDTELADRHVLTLKIGLLDQFHFG